MSKSIIQVWAISNDVACMYACAQAQSLAFVQLSHSRAAAVYMGRPRCVQSKADVQGWLSTSESTSCHYVNTRWNAGS